MINKLEPINTQLQRHIDEIPAQNKRYCIFMSNKHEYHIDGQEFEVIANPTTNFIELKSGDMINKAFIVDIAFDQQSYGKEVVIDGRMDGSKRIPKAI